MVYFSVVKRCPKNWVLPLRSIHHVLTIYDCFMTIVFFVISSKVTPGLNVVMNNSEAFIVIIHKVYLIFSY
ncbi:MAG: hypothetical protein ACJAV1_001973 [Paraglaciecola sp.]|jgi:hypothetical protein